MALILLDAGLVGLAASVPRGRDPEADREGRAFRAWYARTSNTIHRFAIAEVTRYEVLRELLRLGATAKLDRLDELAQASTPLESSAEIWDRAAILWATARRRGRPTAAPDALDGDAILAASALVLADWGDPALVATTNVAHLAWFGVDARPWRGIADSD